MAWHQRNKGTATNADATNWRAESCTIEDLPDRLKAIVAERWLMKAVFWDGVTPGMLTIVSMQSAKYAPKPAKVKKAKAAPSE